MPTMLVFGLGYLGEAVARRLRTDGWSIRVTARDPERRQMLASEGAPAIDPGDAAALESAVAGSDATRLIGTATPRRRRSPAPPRPRSARRRRFGMKM